MWVNFVDHRSRAVHFCSHPGGVGGGGRGTTKQGESPFTAKTQLFIRRFSASSTSGQILPELENVAFCNKILKSVNEIKIGLVLSKL
jgi:hypothetical protein